VFFSDLAGFTSLSETLPPADAVALINRYLAVMSEAIEEHGGFVDKFIGDGIIAVFGAPIAADDHAANAVHAALRCTARLAELNREAQARSERTLRHRIGLSSGAVLVGNVGSHRRLNYTVMGDAVNLASRLEAANDHFGTTILVSESTAAAAETAFAWREIDVIRVRGRAAPVTVFEPFDIANAAAPARAAVAETYAAGLAAWRKRDFAGAAEDFARIAAVDPPAALFLGRAERLALNPPGPDWMPIESLEQK
jgi:adenylate cyclase